MGMILFPRIQRIDVDRLLDDLSHKDGIQVTRQLIADGLAHSGFAASGGSRISVEELLEIRSEVVQIAEQSGFPDSVSSTDKAEFDCNAAVYFATHSLFQSGEALRDDMWAFLTSVLLTDVVIWRFQKKASDRFYGGVRNAFQRLWLRAKALDRGEEATDRWELVMSLTEDACVQIVERPSIGSNSKLSLALAEGWLRTSKEVGRSKMEDLMRRAVIALRLKSQVQLLTALDASEMVLIVDDAFLMAGQKDMAAVV